VIGAGLVISWLAAPLVGVGFTETGPDLARGKRLYEKYCQACHGPQGKGNGVTTFDPPPADLTSSDVLMKPNSRLRRSMHEGRPNTAMDAWKSALSDKAMEDVLAYVLTFPR
jgi:mono/diheme cytochrome c family protein